MSMALLLEYTQEYLRDKHAWEPNQCGVSYRAEPMLQDAGDFFVAIDETGVEAGNSSTDSLKETLGIVIGIWRRPEHLVRDIRHNLSLPLDRYLIGAWTLHELERTIIVHKTVGGAPTRNGLHANYSFLSGLNDRYNLPHADYGAKFITPLFYRGRSAMETVALDGGSEYGDSINTWYGYKLRFGGMVREQKMRKEEDAIG